MGEYISKFKKIHIINYCHQDHAWTNTREWHERRYLAFYDEMLELAEKRTDIPITIDNVLHGPAPCLKYRPETRERFQKAISEGRISVVNGGAALVRPSNSGDETFLRNMIAFRRYYETLAPDAPETKVYLNADTAMGHNQMPQILRLGGFELYRIYRPDALLNAKKIPATFIWKGIDGSEIILSRGTYTSAFNTKWPDADDLEEKMELFIKEEVGDKLLALHTADVLAIFCGGDDSTPLRDMRDNDTKIEDFVRRWNEEKREPELCFSTLDDFLQDIKQCDLPEIELPADGCDVAYNIPFRGNHSFWKKRFEAEKAMVTLEKLASIAQLLGIPYPEKEIEDLWMECLGFAGHAMEFLLEEDFETEQKKAVAAISRIKELTREVEIRLAQKRCTGEENEYVICNPCGFASGEPVKLHITDKKNLNGFRIEDEEGNEVPFQVIGWNYGDKAFPHAEFTEMDVLCDVNMQGTQMQNLHLVKDASVKLSKLAARDVPYFRDRDTREQEAVCETAVLKNEFLEVTVENGMITCVKDVKNRQVLFEHGEPMGTVRLYHTAVQPEWYNSLEPIATSDPVITTFMHVEKGPLRHRCIADGMLGDYKYRQTIELKKGSCRIDFKTEIFVDREGFEGHIKALFPGQDMTDIHAGIPFGAQLFRPEDNPAVFLDHDRQGVFVARHFTSYKTRGQQIAIFQGESGVYMEADEQEQTMGMFLMKGMKNKERTQRWITLVGEDVNGAGNNSFQYSVAFHPEGTEVIWREVQKAEQPTFSFPVMHTERMSDGESIRLIDTGNEKIALSAFYRQDGKGYIRLFNTGNGCEDTVVHTVVDMTNAEICDLRDQVIEKYEGGKLHFHPHEIKTIRF